MEFKLARAIQISLSYMIRFGGCDAPADCRHGQTTVFPSLLAAAIVAAISGPTSSGLKMN